MKKKVWIVIACVLVLAAAGIAAFFAVRCAAKGRSDGASPQETVLETLPPEDATELPLDEEPDEGNKLEEPGVVRHEVTFTDYDPNDFLDTEGKDRQQYSAYAFNIQRCINIYVFQFKDPKTMGLSDLAVTPDNHKLDSLQSTDYLNTLTHPDFPFGCCINNTYIYETQDNGYYNPCFIVSTIAHELGHFLGLLHTFSEDECNEDDACTDTKNCDFNAYT